ncbi:LacI family transcriptional regulator [Mucilaginibacter limnophilus]|uniref:LacI family transcriptional regulator n=1 Tax=Mucilaginibacter limnophilus TaxID=1932778 RepID=A0A3S2V3Q6_9SPHI|nr:substrate-binding domain-containing protein [Mucilaginibacter limnophilus]RVU02589.1 LacI family transcriptional regulator [Mucilaginibacter limnophilus]
MSKKRLSIVDIAEKLNISKTSVSFIMNGRAQEKRISPELVERVMKLVKEVGYKPNSLAKSLRTGKSNIIGLIVEDISDPFFGAIARLIEDKAYKNGYKIIYCSTYNETQRTKEMINMFRDRHVDGYIIVPPEGIEEDIKSLQDDNMPVIMFDRYLPLVDTDYVIVNNQFSAYNATQHLIGQGYKNIALISFFTNQTQMLDRIKGYKMALKENNLKPCIKELPYTQNTKSLVEPITSFLKSKKNIDAILFGTNRDATCGLKVINNLGIRIPDDLAVVTFDDSDAYELHTPQITTIAQPVEEIAESVISTLLAKLKNGGENIKNQSIILHTELIIRGSSVAKSVKA